MAATATADLPMLTALIFDVDGTIADTERDGHRVAFNAAFREAGLDWAWDPATYGELLDVAGGKERLLHYLRRHRPAEAARPDVQERVAALHAAKTRHFVRLLGTGALPLRPGVARLIAEARAEGLALAIATTTTAENVTALLRQGLGDDAPSWFAVIAAGDVVPRKKPAPDVYLYALERLGVPPSACVAFEDSANGLRASLAAGLATVVTRGDYTRAQDFSGATSVLECLGDPGTPAGHVGGAAPRGEFVTIDDLRAWTRARA
jgi:beta-phosphoglucomutase-like phosphatase (HAD superfamily)